MPGIRFPGTTWISPAYPLLYGLDDFSADAREEVQAEIKQHGWRLLEDIPDDVEA